MQQPQQQQQAVLKATKLSQLSVLQTMHDAGWRLPDAEFGRTLLASTISSQQVKITEYLLFTVGCNPNGFITSQDKPWKGDMTTPLHMVCSRGTIEQLALLVWAGADVYANDSSGFIPIAYALHGSCQESHLICKYLEYCGVDRTRVQITEQQKTKLGSLRGRMARVQVRPAAVVMHLRDRFCTPHTCPYRLHSLTGTESTLRGIAAFRGAVSAGGFRYQEACPCSCQGQMP
jgi:hypothetical protein